MCDCDRFDRPPDNASDAEWAAAFPRLVRSLLTAYDEQENAMNITTDQIAKLTAGFADLTDSVTAAAARVQADITTLTQAVTDLKARLADASTPADLGPVEAALATVRASVDAIDPAQSAPVEQPTPPADAPADPTATDPTSTDPSGTGDEPPVVSDPDAPAAPMSM